MDDKERAAIYEFGTAVHRSMLDYPCDNTMAFERPKPKREPVVVKRGNTGANRAARRKAAKAARRVSGSG